jgi:hypothetical protein
MEMCFSETERVRNNNITLSGFVIDCDFLCSVFSLSYISIICIITDWKTPTRGNTNQKGRGITDW